MKRVLGGGSAAAAIKRTLNRTEGDRKQREVKGIGIEWRGPAKGDGKYCGRGSRGGGEQTSQRVERVWGGGWKK